MRKSAQSFAGVYIITHSDGDKVYVGLSVNVNRRWTNHRWHLSRGTHRNVHLQRAWLKYGAKAFRFSVAERVEGNTPEELREALSAAECRVLAKYPKHYNLTNAGEVGMVASDETRAKLSARKLEVWSDPDFKERVRKSQRKAHANSENSENRARAISKTKSTPEAKDKVRAQNAQMWAPGGALRETQGAKRKANWEDPAYRAQQHASRVAAAADPGVKARRSAGIKAAWARRKAAAE